MPPAKQRTPQLREHVLATALRMLAREGAAGFTTRGVARAADTSAPAIYELFGDKSGLVRAVFFEGFALLRARLDTLADSGDARADVIAVIELYRAFIGENPEIAEVMFSRPFSDFDPVESEAAAGRAVRAFVLERVRRAIAAGVLAGEETDVAHVLMALAQGLAAAENARRLGSTRRSIDRRWALATAALLDGLGASARR